MLIIYSTLMVNMMMNIIDNDYTIVIMVINNSDTTIVTIGIMVIIL
jgi:hypothetical protein